MGIETINPATGERVATFVELSPDAIDERLDRAASAAITWRKTSLSERSAVVARMGDILKEREATYAAMMTLEMGKPIKASHDEVSKCADACHYFASHAAEFL